MARLNKLFISCGGTGGHFYPGLSIAREFQSAGGSIRLLLSGKNIASQGDVAKKYSIPVTSFVTHQLSKSPIKMFSSLFLLSIAFFKFFFLIIKEKPDAVLAMGSFASIPPVLAAYITRTPVFLHEGNAFVGKANRFLSRFAKLLAISFPAVNIDSIKCENIEVGMPIRPEMLGAKLSRSEAIVSFNSKYNMNFNPNEKVIFVFGGSLGALVFNKIFPQFYNSESEQFQLVHITGRGNYDTVAESYNTKSEQENVLVLEYAEDMSLLFSITDLVISRSGASTLAELSYYGVPAILVPYPYASDDHQKLNALHFIKRGAAILIENSDFTIERLSEVFMQLTSDKKYLELMSKAMLSLSKPKASSEVLKNIELFLNK